MAESEKNKEKTSKWTVEEVRKLHLECPDDTKLVPYAKIRADDAYKCANIIHVRVDGEWTDSQVSFCTLCRPNTKVI